MGVRKAALYAGGFMGPFAGGMTTAILPELGEWFGISADVAANSIVFYLVPFAGLMLISGRVGEFLGPKRAITCAYFTFFLAAMLCLLAPTWPLFLAGMSLCGIANAFTTPILLATLGATIPNARLGAALGMYAAMQSMGQLSSPLFSGMLAHVDWRFAFGAVGCVALVLGCISIPPMPRTRSSLGLRTVLVLSRPVWGFAIVYFVFGLGLAGLGFLVALRAADAFGSTSTERGLIVMAGGVASLLVSTLAGRIVDHAGGRLVMVCALLLGGGAVVVLPFAPGAIVLALIWGIAMCFGQATQISVNKQVLKLPDAGGAISVVQAFRFFGSAVAPLLLLPLYAGFAPLGFWLPGALVIALGALAALVTGSRGHKAA